jgi:hypothetical protein
MHPKIAEIARQLLPLTENPPARPTKADRDKLMTLRSKIKDLAEESWTAAEETDRRYLYVEATKLANKQEEFWEQNGEKWADQ